MRTKLATSIGAIVLVPATASAQTEGLQPGVTPGVPMAFVANHGQWDARARFRASRGPATAWFVRGGWVLTFEQPQAAADAEPEPELVSRAFARPDSVLGVAVAMTFEGATAEPVGEGLLPGEHHYLLGADPRRWARHVPLHGRLRYPAIHPGIDVVARDNGRFLEYDLEVAAGTDVERVVIRVAGAERVRIDAGGALVFETPLGDVRQGRPVSWEVRADGTEQPVQCRYRILGRDRYGFEVSGRALDRPLVIDPGIDWGTPLGGSADDKAFDVHRSSAGIVTVAGATRSTSFPVTPGAYRRLFGGGSTDAWVARLDPSRQGASQLRWSTFLGGRSDDSAWDLAVDASGVATVAGYTRSPDFPTRNGLQPAPAGLAEAFVARLDASGANLLYGTLFGGQWDDWACSVDVDASGMITLAGFTESPVRTTAGAFQRTLKGRRDAFVARLDPSQAPSSQLLWSTLLGGSNTEGNNPFPHADNPNMKWLDMVVEPSRIAVAGVTASADFPVTSGAIQTRHAGSGDVFFAQLDGAGSALVYGTFLGGRDGDAAWRLVKHPLSGYVLGGIARAGFPVTPGAFQTVYRDTDPQNRGDGFVAWIVPNGAGRRDLRYCTLLGSGNRNAPYGEDIIAGLAVDAGGLVSVGGYAHKGGLPATKGAFREVQAPVGGGAGFHSFVARLQMGGRGQRDLHYLSYVYQATNGGGIVMAIAVDELGVATIAGQARDAPLRNPVHLPAGGLDALMARIDMLPSLVDRYGVSTPACAHPIYQRVDSQPAPGNARFTVLATGAAPSTSGALVLGMRHTPGFAFLNLRVHLSPIWPVILPATCDALGHAEMPLPIPPSYPGPGAKLALQWVFLNTPQCPGTGILSTSHGMELF